MSSQEIVTEISEKTGIDAEDITIGVEYDGDGKVVRILVYVSDENKADKVVSSVTCGEIESCEGLSCYCEEVESHEKARPLNLSEGHSNLSNKLIVLALISFIVSNIF